MRNLKKLQPIQYGMDIGELTELVSSFTIQEKMDFSTMITCDRIREKLKDLRIQVPKRDVLLDMTDEAVTFYWFKNWLHPDLTHWVYPSPGDKRGCTTRVLQRDMVIDSIRNMENAQFHYNYTMADIVKYLEEGDEKPNS